MEEPVLLSISVPGHQIDDLSGRTWLAGATGIAEEWIAGDEQVRLLVSCEPADQAAVALALGGDATEVDSWTPVVKRVAVAFEGRVIDLDVPANVFGDGAHPTTMTCLKLVSDLVTPGDQVLDIGCGAGLLSVAAAVRGATVTAIDIWEPAVETTRGNAARAGVAARVDVAARSIDARPTAPMSCWPTSALPRSSSWRRRCWRRRRVRSC